MIVVYRSEALAPMSTVALVDLARRSAENNQKIGVTGFLVERDGVFLQVLEGDVDAVEPLLARIAADPRHCAMTILHKNQQATERNFNTWAMNATRIADSALRASVDALVPSGLSFQDASRHPDFALKTLMVAYVDACIVGAVPLYGQSLG